MSRIVVGMDGLPVDAGAPRVMAPGQSAINLGLAESPAGVVLVAIVDGRRLPVQLPPGKATEFGVALIQAEAAWRLRHPPEPGPALRIGD